MAEMKKMWAVSQGSYSDYRVMCVCLTEEDAKQVAEKYNRSQGSSAYDAGVEELLVVDGNVERVVVLILSTTLWDDGRETNPRDETRFEWPFDSMYGPSEAKWRWVRAPIYKERGGRLDVHGIDHERVRKVFSEQRAALLADDAYRARQTMEGGR